MTRWVTADTHFGHENIIHHSQRPFKSALEMDEALVANWNARVRASDTVYHLGDFAYRTSKRHIADVLSRLNGKMLLVPGGHDRIKQMRQQRVVRLDPMVEIETPDGKGVVVLCHYPIESWNQRQRGRVHLHGHSHGKGFRMQGRCDMGVDSWGFAPVELGEAIQRAADGRSGWSPEQVERLRGEVER